MVFFETLVSFDEETLLYQVKSSQSRVCLSLSSNFSLHMYNIQFSVVAGFLQVIILQQFRLRALHS